MGSILLPSIYTFPASLRGGLDGIFPLFLADTNAPRAETNVFEQLPSVKGGREGREGSVGG